MRLTTNQVEAIKGVTAEVFGAGAKALLFGSRVDDTKRGGDIDLYITDIELGADERFDAKIRFLVELKRRIGEQRVDVVLSPQSASRCCPFIARPRRMAFCYEQPPSAIMNHTDLIEHKLKPALSECALHQQRLHQAWAEVFAFVRDRLAV